MKMKKATPAGALLRKDIFRFAPLWGGYFAIVLVVLLFWIGLWEEAVYKAYTIVGTLTLTGIVNAVYAGIVAMLLFGDLFSAKRCEALHAMPLPREKWFFSHILNGCLYSFVPNLVVALCVMPALREFWNAGFVWLLGMTLQYLFFFGLAVLCVFISGNRIGMLLFYGIFNVTGMVAQWFASAVFLPLLNGVILEEGWFYRFSPVFARLAETYPPSTKSYRPPDPRFEYSWGCLALYAGIGVVLLGIALLLYRKRKLECAGDLIAVKPFTLIFMVMFALCIGCGFAVIGSLLDVGSYLIFFVPGLILGWFGGQMLLQRTVRVLKGKVFVQLGVLIFAMALSLGLTALDPVGVTRYVPEADSVQKVELTPFNHKSLGLGLSSYILHGTDPEMIESIVTAQEQILKDGQNGSQSGRVFSIRYTLSSGKQVVREYNVARGTQAWQCLREIWNTPEHLLGYTDWETWHGSVWNVRLNQYTVAELQEAYKKQTGQQWLVSTQQMEEELLRALVADVEEGHAVDSVFRNEEDPDYCVQLTCSGEKRTTTYYVHIGKEARHCYAWMEKYRDLMELVEWRL